MLDLTHAATPAEVETPTGQTHLSKQTLTFMRIDL